MSWHPSRASSRPRPAAPSQYRSATVQSRTGRSMLVQLDDGHDRLLPVPAAPETALVGSRVLVANDYDWVVAVDGADPIEHVAVSRADDVVVDLRHAGGTTVSMGASSDEDFGEDLRDVDLRRFDRRLEHLQRRRRSQGVTTFRKVTW